MPVQPLLKATLLKEAYGQLVELNGTEEKDAVKGGSPSRLNSTERQLFDVIAPEVVPEKEFQKRRQPGWLRKTGLQIKDLLDVYERLVGARSKDKSTDRRTTWRRSVYKGFSAQLHKKVGTTKRESRNFPSDDVDFDRAGKPFSSPAESLKSHGNASLESVEAECEERSCRVLDWDDNEHPSEIQTPLVRHRMRNRQGEESRSTNGAKIETEHTISRGNSSEASDCDQKSSAKSLEGLSEMGQGQSAEEDSRRTGIASRPCHSKSPCMPITTESERNCNPVDGKVFDTVMTKAIQPSAEDSTWRGAKANFSANRSGSVSLRERLAQDEDVEDRRSSSSRQVSDLGLVSPRSTNAHDPTLRTTKGDAEEGDQSLIDLSRNDGEFEQLSGQEVNCRTTHNYGNEKDDHVNDITEKSTSDRSTVDAAKQALRPSEQPEVSESSFAKGNGRSHRRSSSLEIIYNMFGKCRLTAQAKHDFSRGCPEDSHIIENSSATSRSNFHHPPHERFSNGLEDGQSMTESTEILSADFSKDSRSDVSEGNHNSSAASKAQSGTFSLMERSVIRYGKSKSTNETRAFPAACTRSWSRAGPTVASAPIEKVQKVLGRNTSLRTTQVEQEETKSTQHSEERHDVSRTPLRGDPTHDNSRSSLRQLLRDESTFVWSRGSTRTAEHSPQEEGQKFISLVDVKLNDLKKTDSSADSPLVWTFKRILCCGQCDGRIKIVTDWVDGVDWTCHTKVRKALEQEDRSVCHSDGYSPPQRLSPQKRTSCRSPRSSSTRKKLSPKRKNDHATRHTRRPGKLVRSDESNKRNMPNRFVLRQHRTEPIPSKGYPKGWNAEELTYSGAPRAGSTGESELADISHSGARNHTSIEQARVGDHQDNKASELWRPPISSYRRQRRRSTGRSTPTSRFQRECIARQSNSTSPTSTPENQRYPSTTAAALLDSTDQEDSESEIVHRQLECVR